MSWKRRLSEMMLAGGAVGLCVGYDEGCTSSSDTVGCCNANGDPCCPVDYCGAPMSPECQAEKSCQAAGGEYSDLGQCFDDGGKEDATPSLLGCCNANGDPCCPFLYCDAGITAQCQAELACIDAGRWDGNTDTCVAPSDADASTATDANADAEANANVSDSDAAANDAFFGDADD